MSSIKLDIGLGKQIGALPNNTTTETNDLNEETTNNNFN
jgi:hypothetical protein